jgi:GTP-binding protein HflX
VEKVYLVGVELAGNSEHAATGLPGSPANEAGWSVEQSLAELSQLAATAGYQVLGSLSQKLRRPNPAHYIGKGKLEQLAGLKSELGFGTVIFDDELAPSQQRRLEDILQVRVIDRTALILEIFAQRARTHEGRIQVQLALNKYMLPRLTRQWTHLERQMGDIGARGGPGETQLEVDRRKVRERIEDLTRELEGVRRHRALSRRQRAREGVPVASLVGYTNAGKSTLLNALTGAGVLSEDQLFATLDPVVRRIVLPTGREAVLSDTVGFINKLPTTLVAAFRATLEELDSADVLLNVMDITHPSGWEQGQVVARVLEELNLSDKPVITVLNKVDRLLDQDPYKNLETRLSGSAELADLDELRQAYPNAVLVSAAFGWGLEELRATIDRVLADNMVPVKVQLPYRAAQLVHLFHQRGAVSEERYTDQGTIIEGKLPPQLAHQFKPYSVR